MVAMGCTTALAEKPILEWEKTFGGSHSDQGYSVQQTVDGGFIIAGRTDSYGAGYHDVYLIKTNSKGNLVWQKTFGGSSYDGARSVQESPDGGYIIAGSTESFAYDGEDVYLIRTDSAGHLLWQKTFRDRWDDSANSVWPTTDGGCIVAGWTAVKGHSPDAYLIKTDPAGNLIWEKTFSGRHSASAHSVQQTADGGYIIAGSTRSFGAPHDVYLLKTNSAGNLIWQKTFGGADYDYGRSVQQTTDGGFIIAGFTESFGAGDDDVYLIKTNSAGKLLWQKTFGWTGEDRGYSVRETADGGYIIAGYAWGYLGTGGDVYLIKTDSTGNLIWEQTFGDIFSEEGRSAQQTTDGGYIIVGTRDVLQSADVYLIKVKPVPAAVMLLAPNGGEELLAGSTYDIIWETTGDVDCVFIEYSDNNGQSWTPTVWVHNEGGGVYRWLVPAVNSGQCLVRISDADCASVNDVSDEVFRIYMRIIYVDVDAIGANDGSSWADAYNYLQDALAHANTNPWVDEIWVVKGIYKPDRDKAYPAGTRDRTATFQLINGVAIYGGFPSGGGRWAQRDPDVYKSILSGDLAGDDVQVADPSDLLDEPTRAENSYHVVTGSGTDTTAVLDGFTITGGNANKDWDGEYCGGGMCNNSGSPTVRDCTFKGNSAGSEGGGMYNSSGSPMVIDCTFSGNWSGWGGGGMHNYYYASPMVANCTFSGNSSGWAGGGIFNDRSSPAVTNCMFSGNSADDGGGMYNRVYSSPTLTNCTFSGNSAEFGGGMENSGYYGECNPTLTNCTFSGNWAYYGGGMYNSVSQPTLTNCTFSENSVRDSAGGMYNADSSPRLTNCTFTGNSAEADAGGMKNHYSSPTLTNCVFSGNSAGHSGLDSGGGISNVYSSPMLTTCTFSRNLGKFGGGMDNLESSPTLTNCEFRGNSADNCGGGMLNRRSSPTLTNCTFSENSAGLYYGGGMYNIVSSNPTLTNCTFSGNSAYRDGGGMYNYESSPTLANCTFSGNSSGDLGGGIYNWTNSNSTVTNCIFWGNTAPSGAQIYNDGTSSLTITYSDIQGRWPGIGNIDDDPLFVDADGPDNIAGTEDDNLRLLPDSNCIDAGDNNSVPADTADLDGDANTTEPTPWDLDSRPRISDGDCNDTEVVDMGAYEFNYAYMGDFDGECDVDFADFAILALAWLTEPPDENWNQFCDISIPADKKIDWADVEVLSDNWLAGLDN